MPEPLARSLRASARVGAGLAGLSLALAGAVAVPAQAAPWDDATRMCRIKDTRVVENSGMSRSTYGRRVLFVHNDSGGGAEFFAIRAQCGTKAVFTVPGAPAKDWEDMASGPDHTLWFGDIGGNRSEVNVVRVKEPRSLRSRALRHTAYRLRYPDGAHNAEAMMVRPRSGRLYVITKAASGAGIYRARKKLVRGAPNRLTRVADVPRRLTGADFSRTGRLFVLRGYRTAFVYSSLQEEPISIELPPAHTFGEAVAFDRSGGMVFGAEGVREWLWRIR